MGQYKGIIFDLDGVICFTDEYHYRAWKAIADELGAYFDREINNRLRGVSRMASLNIVLERYDGTLTVQEKEALTLIACPLPYRCQDPAATGRNSTRLSRRRPRGR